MKKLMFTIPMMLLFNISCAQKKPKEDCSDEIEILRETIEILKQSVEIDRLTSKLQRKELRRRDSIITIQDSLLVRFRNNLE